MATNLEGYEMLKKHMHEEAARVIAEALPIAEQVVTKDYLDARLAEVKADTHRWLLTMMASQWLGLAAIIIAILLKS